MKKPIKITQVSHFTMHPWAGVVCAHCEEPTTEPYGSNHGLLCPSCYSDALQEHKDM